ncbi:MAG TPA: hypothetical protein DF383_03605, partial [Deltaproteobacteria bacterium]|nr:hypothetical protein [Deltaproteobacteria bacterium]
LGLIEKIQSAWITFVNTPVGGAIEDFLKGIWEGLALLLDDVAAYFEGRQSVTGSLIDAFVEVVKEWKNLFVSFFDFVKAGFLDLAESTKRFFDPRTTFSEIRRYRSGEAFKGFNQAKENLNAALQVRADKAMRFRELTIFPGLEAIARAMGNIQNSDIAANSGKNLGSTLNRDPSSIMPGSSKGAGASLGNQVVNSNNKSVTIQPKIDVRVLDPEELRRSLEGFIGNMLRMANNDMATAGV